MQLLVARYELCQAFAAFLSQAASPPGQCVLLPEARPQPTHLILLPLQLAMLLATVPPLFMSIMDAQVDAYTAARAAAAAQQLGQEASGEQAAAGAAAD